MDINWTAVLVGAFTSAVNGVATFLSVRFLSRVVERVEKTHHK